MLSFLLQRFTQSIGTLVAISLLVFVMMFCIGDPVATLLPPTASVQQRVELREALGLDQPLAIQYGRFIGRLARGDLGTSYYAGRPVSEMLAERAPATLELALVAMLIAVGLGVPLGMIAGARPQSWFSRVAMGGSLFGISVPTFWLGLMLIMIFAVMLGWLPTDGRGRTVSVLGMECSLLTADGWRHLALPAVTLALHHLAMLMRLVRSEMAETLRRPFIRACRARGISEASVVGCHALRNTLIPVLTVVGLQFGGLLAFSVVTETIFQWPGLGKLLIDSIQVDRPLVVAYLLLTGVLFLGINFLVDVAYAFIDPRIRLASTSPESC